MPQVQPKTPRLATEQLEPCDLAEIRLRAEADWQHLSATGLASGEATDARFDEIEWHSARLGAVNWERAHWRDCRFNSCDLAGARAAKLAVTRAAFNDCRLKGLVAPESDWNDVSFRDCNLSGAQLRFARWKRAHFHDCDLSGADFAGADARGLVFAGCDLRGASFNFAQLNGADWRGCQTEEVQINARALQGLICEPLQAAQFAGVLGLDVRWEGERQG